MSLLTRLDFTRLDFTRLDPRGRLSRRAYGRLFIRLSLLTVLLLCLTIWVAVQGWRDAAFAVAGCAVLLWIASFALAVRRLHDRDRTGWWLAIYLILAGFSLLPVEKAADAHPVLVTAYALGSLGFSLWFLVETLGRRGTAGPNRYGPAPVE